MYVNNDVTAEDGVLCCKHFYGKCPKYSNTFFSYILDQNFAFYAVVS